MRTLQFVRRFCNSAAAIVIAAVLGTVVWNGTTFSSALVALAAGVALLALRRSGRARDVFRCGFPAMVVAQLFLGYFLMVGYGTWDVWTVTRQARHLALGQPVFLPYFAQCTNNAAITAFNALVFWISHVLFDSTSIYILVVVNVIAIDCAVLLAVRIARRLAGEDGGYLVGVLLLLYSPLYLWVPICYTDTMSMPLILLSIWGAMRIAGREGDVSRGQWREIGGAALLGLAIAVAYLVKGSGALCLIAVAIYFLLAVPFGRFLRLMLGMIPAFAALVLIWNAIVTAYVTPEEFEKHGFPLTHWVMMGLRDEGRFSADDQHWTSSFGTLDEKRAAVNARLRERIAEKGARGLAAHCFRKATQNCWQNGTCWVERYLGDQGDKPLRRNALHEFVLSRGSRHAVLERFSFGIYSLVCLLFMLNAVLAVREREVSGDFLMRILLAGAMVFFMIWETHPRYSLHLMPVMIVLAGVQLARLRIPTPR